MGEENTLVIVGEGNKGAGHREEQRGESTRGRGSEVVVGRVNVEAVQCVLGDLLFSTCRMIARALIVYFCIMGSSLITSSLPPSKIQKKSHSGTNLGFFNFFSLIPLPQHLCSLQPQVLQLKVDCWL